MADRLRILTVLTGPVVEHHGLRPGQVVASALVKHQRHGQVAIRVTGLDGDAQADQRHHGGAAKAVLMLADSTRRSWPQRLPGFTPRPGGFGENLLIDGMDEDTICLGDRWQGPQCILVVTQPRRPCWKPGALAGIAGLAQAMARSGATGWYLAVAEPGSVGAEDLFTRIEQPYPRWTISTVNRVLHGNDAQLIEEWLAAPPPGLDRWQPTLTARATALRAGRIPDPDPAWNPEGSSR